MVNYEAKMFMLYMLLGIFLWCCAIAAAAGLLWVTMSWREREDAADLNAAKKSGSRGSGRGCILKRRIRTVGTFRRK